jgi:hypothetical protein
MTYALPSSCEVQRTYDALFAQGLALLPEAHRCLEPEMAVFLEHYLFALSYDVDEALQREGAKQEALLQLTVGELADLVRELKRRLARGQPGGGEPQLQNAS